MRRLERIIFCGAGARLDAGASLRCRSCRGIMSPTGPNGCALVPVGARYDRPLFGRASLQCDAEGSYYNNCCATRLLEAPVRVNKRRNSVLTSPSTLSWRRVCSFINTH